MYSCYPAILEPTILETAILEPHFLEPGFLHTILVIKRQVNL